ncbi:ankyrin repeat domain-containing protein, partial [bacterium]
FGEPVKKLERELRNIGENKSYKKIISSFPNFHVKLNKLNEYMRMYKKDYSFKEKFKRKLLYLDYVKLAILPDIIEGLFSKIDNLKDSSLDQEGLSYKKVSEELHLLEKIKEIKERLLKQGKQNTKGYKKLVEILKKRKLYNHSKIIFTTAKGTLLELQRRGLIDINSGYVINKVKNWPYLICYDYSRSVKRESKKVNLKILLGDCDAFTKDKALLRLNGCLKLNYILRDKIGYNLTFKQIEEIKSQLKSIKQWPQNRKDIELIASNLRSYRELTGLENINDMKLIGFLVHNLLQIYDEAYSIIYEIVIHPDEKDTTELIEKNFELLSHLKLSSRLRGLKDSERLNKLICVLKSKKISKKDLERIVKCINPEKQKLIFVVKDLNKYNKFKFKGITFVDEIKNIEGKEINESKKDIIILAMLNGGRIYKYNFEDIISGILLVMLNEGHGYNEEDRKNNNNISAIVKQLKKDLINNDIVGYIQDKLKELIDRFVEKGKQNFKYERSRIEFLMNIKDESVAKRDFEKLNLNTKTIWNALIKKGWIDKKGVGVITEEFKILKDKKNAELKNFGKTQTSEIISILSRQLSDQKLRRNTSREILLFLAVEQHDKKLIKKLFEQGVCLDIWRKDGKSLFHIASNIAMRTKNLDIFELLTSEISNRPIYDKKLKERIEKYIKYFYKDELEYLKKTNPKIDPIKDFPKLKKLRPVKIVFNKYKKLGELPLTLESFQQLIFNIYKSYNEIPDLDKLESILKAA